MDLSEGVVYVATGDTSIAEALYSARSLKRHNPLLTVCVFTESKSAAAVQSDSAVDLVREVDPAVHPFRLKVYSMINSPFVKTLFLDSDTKILGDVMKPFSTLDSSDVAIAAMRWLHGEPGDVRTFRAFEKPSSRRSGWPVFNAGVIYLKKSESFLRFANEWQSRVPQNPRLSIDSDQDIFNHLLGERYDEACGLVVEKLPNIEYNCRLIFLPHLSKEQRRAVKILHEHLLNRPLKLRLKMLKGFVKRVLRNAV